MKLGRLGKLYFRIGLSLAMMTGFVWHFKFRSTKTPVVHYQLSPPLIDPKKKEVIGKFMKSFQASANAPMLSQLERKVDDIRKNIVHLNGPQKGLAAENLQASRYELEILRAENKRLNKSRGQGKIQTDFIEKKLNVLVKDLDRLYLQAQSDTAQVHSSAQEILKEIGPPRENRPDAHKALRSEIPKQHEPPPQSKKTSKRSWFEMQLEKAYAAEVMGCAEAFFSEPTTTELAGDYLSLSKLEYEISSEMVSYIQSKSALDIFKFVKNEVRYEPYVGAVQNAKSVFVRKSGNAHDQATLLIALLRKANTPARYVIGDVLVEETMLKKLWRVEDSLSVWNISVMLFPYFESVHGKSRWLSANGKIYYLVPHVWVEAFIPFDQKRGAGIQTATKSWVPMDPTFENVNVKNNSITRQLIESEASSENLDLFNMGKFLLEKDPETGSYIKQATGDEVYIGNVVQILKKSSEENPWTPAFTDLKNTGEVVRSGTDMLEIGPMGAETCISKKTAFLPDDQKTRIKIEVNGISQELKAIEVGDKSIYVIWRGTTSSDEQKLDQLSQGTLTSVSGIYIKPQLYVDDDLIAMGNSVVFGDSSMAKASYIGLADGYTSVKRHYFDAGRTVSLGVSSSQNSENQIGNRLGQLTSQIQGLSLSNLSYFERAKITGKTLSTALQIVLFKGKTVSENIAAASNEIHIDSDVVFMNAGIKPTVLFDRILGYVPEKPIIDWMGGGFYLTRQSVYPITDDRYYSTTSSQLAAGDANLVALSALENKIFEDFFSLPGQSTVKVIQTAKENSIPVFSEHVTDLNGLNAILNQLQGYRPSFISSFRSDVKKFPARIIIPQQPVSVGWNTFDVGLYIDDTRTDWVALIGQQNGGWTGSPNIESPTGYSEDNIADQLASLDLPVESTSDHSDYKEAATTNDAFKRNSINGAPAASGFGCPPNFSTAPVNYNNGAMWHIFEDFKPINGPGVPLSFARTYLAQSTYNGSLGYGWTHNWNIRLETTDGTAIDVMSNKDLNYFNEQNVTIPITFKSTNEASTSGSGYKAVLNPSHKMKFAADPSNDEFIMTDSQFTKFRFYGSGNFSGKLKTIEDRNGNVLQLTYDATSRLLSQITDSVGRSLNFAYNSDNRISRVTDFSERFVEFTYDSRGDLIQSQDLNGNATTYSYLHDQVITALNHNLASFRNPEGHGIDYFYYSNDKVFKHVEPEGKRTIFIYNTFTQETSEIDGLGNRKIYQYDMFGNVRKTINPDGTFVARKFDIFGNKSEETDEEGFVTKYSADSRGNIVKITASAPLGAVETVYHAKYNTPVSIKDGNGHVKVFEIDGPGNILSEKIYKDEAKTQALVTSYSYQADGRLKSVTDPKGKKTAYSRSRTLEFSETMIVQSTLGDTSTHKFDPFGRLVESIDFNGKREVVTYDNLNQPLSSEVIGSGIRTELQYDKVGNLRFQKRITGSKILPVEHTYDGLRNRISTRNELGELTKFEYIVPGCGCGMEAQLRTMVDPKGNRTEYEYNWRGKVIQLRDPRGNRTVFTYDNRGNQTSIKVFDKAGGNLFATSSEYGSLNKLKRQTDHSPITWSTLTKNYYKSYAFSGNYPTTTEFIYDLAGNLIEKKTQRSGFLGESVKFSYLPTNRLKTKTLVSDFYPETVSFEYDDNLNPTKIQSKDSLLEFGYDDLNRATVVKTRTDAGLGILQPNTELQYSFDKMGQVAKISENNQAIVSYVFDSLSRINAVTAGNSIVGIGYDEFSRKNSISYPNNLTTTLIFDDASRVASIQTPRLGSLDYSFDKDGNITKIRSERGEWDYGYDQSNWLIRAHYKGSGQIPNENIAWDAVGNRLSGIAIPNNVYVRGFAVNARPLLSNNHLLEDAEPTNDGYKSGRYAYRYDFKGNVIERYDNNTDEKIFYEYNAENRLMLVKKAGVGNAFINQTAYKYDGLGRRVAKEVTFADGTVDRTSYIYDRENIFFEYDKTNTRRALYIGTGEIDNHLMMIRDNKPHYYHTDHLGSTIALSDELGRLEERISYSAFGKMTEIRDGNNQVVSSPVVANLYYFTGRERDFEAGHDYYRARYYDPTTGRFLTKDPLGPEAGGDINPYRYAMNNPVNFTDPMGLKTQVMITYDTAYGIEFGSHAAARVDNAGNPVLFDPNGSFNEPYRGSSPMTADTSLSNFIDYHQHSGSRVEVFQFNTTNAQEAAIAGRAGAYQDPRVFNCASGVCDVLGGVGPFNDLNHTALPGRLGDQLLNIPGGSCGGR